MDVPTDPKMDPGAKMGLGRPKNQSAQNHLKMDVCVGLIVTNPTQLERAQTNVVCEIYHDLFVLPNMQNFDDFAVHTVSTWQLTVQVVQPYMWCGSGALA
jgi:hypothetical protein